MKSYGVTFGSTFVLYCFFCCLFLCFSLYFVFLFVCFLSLFSRTKCLKFEILPEFSFGAETEIEVKGQSPRRLSHGLVITERELTLDTLMLSGRNRAPSIYKSKPFPSSNSSVRIAGRPFLIQTFCQTNGTSQR